MSLSVPEKFAPHRGEDVCNLKEPFRFPKIASYKIDGIRALTHSGAVYSKSNKLIRSKLVQETLSKYQGFDGELVVGPPHAQDVYYKTQSAVNAYDRQFEFQYLVFDCIQDLRLGFQDRQVILQEMMKQPLPSCIQLVPQFLITSEAQLDEVYQNALRIGWEGLILREPNSTYHFGKSTARSQNLLKVKPHADSEAVVLGFYEALENQNESFIDELGRVKRSTSAAGLVPKGTLGGFHCKDLYSGVEFDAACGILTAPQRQEIWDNQAKYMSRVFTYRHLGTGVKDKPRHGRFYRWKENPET